MSVIFLEHPTTNIVGFQGAVQLGDLVLGFSGLVLFGPVVLRTNRCGKDIPALLGCAEESLDEAPTLYSFISSTFSVSIKLLI